jgi:SPP1 family predicted phage head-tail adaptor
MTIDVGRMRERVTVYASREVPTRSGNPELVYDDEIATVWASVEGLSSKDILQAQQANVIATHKVRMRYRDDILHTHRISWRGRTLEIASVTPRVNRETLELIVREVT